MSHFRISTRLAISFLVMVLLLMGLGGITLFLSSAQHEAMNDIVQRRIPITKALAALAEGTNTQAIQFRNLALFPAPDIQKSARAQIDASRAEATALLETLVKLVQSEKGLALLANIQQLRETYFKLSSEFLELHDQGRHDQALDFLVNKQFPTQLEYQRAINDQIEFSAQRMASASEKAENAVSDLQRNVVLAAALAIVLALFLAISIIRSITRPLTQAVAMADRVAAGDLSGDIAVSARDEMGQLLGALGRMQQSLVKTVTIVRTNAQGVASASAQIAAGNHDLSGRTEEQASALEETAASMEQLSSTVKHNADNARQANQMAVSASGVAAQGGEAVTEVVETMKSIDESSHRIADIIGVIDGIAFQTNILALNAAVEAARAGEQGRGFAVVASEVRALAGRSAEAAKEIKALITTSVEHVEHGTQLVDKAGRTMTEVVAAIRRVTDIMGEISAASHEQSSGVSQIGEAVTQMDQTTQQNAALVEEMAAAASSLNNQAQSLVQAVAVFKLSEHESLVQAANRAQTTQTGSMMPSRVSKPAAKPVPQPATALRRPAAIAGTRQSAVAMTESGDWEAF
ncbi:methyl-accepting chemotaxis protein [Comamonas testosteroni]|uniref:methyl-accepting chemotaxis protein n=1 Tax=Comamonas testosteroni TaxID=285 RepID=UPI0005B4AAD1|nr:methyl-accepting chemotaxis protein [Comamonas testosteroni]